MGYMEAIKDGFRVIHRTWQLVLVQLGMVFITSIGFFIFVGIPLAVAFIILGTDLTGLFTKSISTMLEQPSELLSQYFGLVLIAIACLLVYILAAATFSIYVFGGTIGVIGRAFTDKTLQFTMQTFFSEARRLFLPLIGFTALIGLVLIVILFLLGILGGGITILVSFAKSQDTTLALFLGIFVTLISIIIAIIFILLIISITIYGVAELSFRSTGPMKSLKEATNYLVRNPKALWLNPILLAGYVLIILFIALLGYPFSLIPVIGTILFFPYQLISYAFLTYIGLAMIAAVFAYYYYSTELFGGSEAPSKSLNALS